MVTRKQKPTVDTKKIKRKELDYHYRKSSIQNERQQGRKERKIKLQNSWKTINKMSLVSLIYQELL